MPRFIKMQEEGGPPFLITKQSGSWIFADEFFYPGLKGQPYDRTHCLPQHDHHQAPPPSNPPQMTWVGQHKQMSPMSWVTMCGSGQGEEARLVQGRKEVSLSPRHEFLLVPFKTFTSPISIQLKTSHLQLQSWHHASSKETWGPERPLQSLWHHGDVGAAAPLCCWCGALKGMWNCFSYLIKKSEAASGSQMQD